jgi:hypothetical protein
MSASAHMAHKATEMFLHSSHGKAAVASTAALIVVAAPVLAPAAAITATVVVATGCFVALWKAGEWLTSKS